MLTNYCLMQVKSIAEKHFAILSTCIKLPSVFKIFVLSIFEWLLRTGFTVFKVIALYFSFGLSIITAFRVTGVLTSVSGISLPGSSH